MVIVNSDCPLVPVTLVYTLNSGIARPELRYRLTRYSANAVNFY